MPDWCTELFLRPNGRALTKSSVESRKGRLKSVCLAVAVDSNCDRVVLDLLAQAQGRSRPRFLGERGDGATNQMLWALCGPRVQLNTRTPAKNLEGNYLTGLALHIHKRVEMLCLLGPRQLRGWNSQHCRADTNALRPT